MLVGAKYKSVWKLLASQHFGMEFELTEKVKQFIEQNKLQSSVTVKGSTAKLIPEKARELLLVSGLFLHRQPAIASIKELMMAEQKAEWSAWLSNPDSPFYDQAFVEAYQALEG